MGKFIKNTFLRRFAENGKDTSPWLKRLRGKLQSQSGTCHTAIRRIPVELLTGMKFASDVGFRNAITKLAPGFDKFAEWQGGLIEKLMQGQVKEEEFTLDKITGRFFIIRSLIRSGKIVVGSYMREDVSAVIIELKSGDAKFQNEDECGAFIKKIGAIKLTKGAVRVPHTRPYIRASIRKRKLLENGTISENLEIKDVERKKEALECVYKILGTKKPSACIKDGSNNKHYVGGPEVGNAILEKFLANPRKKEIKLLQFLQPVEHCCFIVGVAKRNGVEYLQIYDQNYKRAGLPPVYELPISILMREIWAYSKK